MSDFALFLIRFTIGAFFVVYRFRWVYDPTSAAPWLNSLRHMNLEQKLCACGWGMRPKLAAFVAAVEITAGLGLMAGQFSLISAVAILSILLVATACTASEKINRQKPIDAIDVVSCYLWTVEPTYIIMTVAVICIGPGHWSADFIFNPILHQWFW